MDVTEVESFVQKFKNLWKSGFSAHLDLDTHSGQAWVGLRVRLGHHHQVQQPRKARNGPSRQRRRARRADARKENVEDVETASEAVEAMVTIDAEEANENSEPVAEEAKENLEPVVAEEAISESNADKSVEIVAEDATAENDDKDTTVVNESATSDYSAVVQDEVCDDTFYDDEKARSDHITVVHAVATFRNSPNDTLSQDDINSLQNYIYSEEHLKRNITKIEFEKLSRWEVSTKLFVLTNNLWEGPRGYLWKHLGGQNLWDRSNGTKIKLEKIHVK
jgi:hypothetical protein